MNKFLKYISFGAIALALLPLTACSDDEVDPYDINYIYLYQPDETFAAIEYKANGNFISDFSDPLELVPVRLTKPAPSNIAVEVAIDQSLVDEYNASSAANGVQYTFLTGASVVNPNMTITQGNYTTDEKIKISFSDRSGFMTDAENLILPIVIKQASAGVTISQSSRIFLIFNSTYRANKVTLDASFLSIDTNADNWKNAYRNYTISDFATAEWAADDNISMTVTIDQSLVNSYNSENGTSFKPLGANLANNQITLAAGKKSLDLQLTLDDYSGIANGDEYLVPIKVSSFSGVGAELQNNVVYLQIGNTPPAYTAGDNANSLDLGTPLSPGNWTLTSSFNGYDHLGNDTTECSFLATSPEQGYFGFDEGNAITIDFGNTMSIKGFSFSFYAWYYSVKSFTAVETSKDGSKWTSWSLDGIFPQSAQTVACKFTKSENCRYIRVTMGAPAYSSYYGSYATAFYAY